MFESIMRAVEALDLSGEREAERRRRDRRRSAGIVGGVAGGIALAGAVAAVSAASGPPPPGELTPDTIEARLRRSYWRGFTDSGGQESLAEFEAWAAEQQRTLDDQRQRRAARRVTAYAALLLGVVGAVTAVLGPDARLAAAGTAAVALVVAIRQWLVAGPAIPDFKLPPKPVVLPSAPRKSPAAALLATAAARRASLQHTVARIAPTMPQEAQLVEEARVRSEDWISKCAIDHEVHRYQLHRDRTPDHDCGRCSTHHEALQHAVEEYVQLEQDAATLASEARRATATEAIARRAGLQALAPPLD